MHKDSVGGSGPEPAVRALRGRVPDHVRAILRRSSALGFLGGMSLEEQLDHALGFVFSAERSIRRAPTSVLDLGSGGGVPGLILTGCWPQSRIVLMDANERRTDFLIDELAEWDQAGSTSVARARAEELGRKDDWREQFELVTSRSFGPPAVTAECGAAFLKVGGIIVISEPPDGDVQPESRWSTEGLGQIGLELSTKVRFDDRFGFQVLRKTSELSDRYPRRVGIPSKRPLF